MNYSYGSNYTPERLEELNVQHKAMLKEIGAVYDEETFWIGGLPQIRLYDTTLKASGKSFDPKPFHGRLIFHKGASVVATGDNPFPCSTTRITLVRWGEGGDQCGRIETASELNHTALVSSVGIRIGKNVLLGPNVTIMKGVTVGHHAVVAANATVVKDVPPHAVVAGCPARVIKRIEP